MPGTGDRDVSKKNSFCLYSHCTDMEETNYIIIHLSYGMFKEKRYCKDIMEEKL